MSAADPPASRLAFAAAHVVMRADYRSVDHGPDRPGSVDEIAAHIDWDATIAIRARLGSLGFGVAEAMDTAQRFEIGWPAALRLIEETGRLGLDAGFIAGAGSDQLDRVDGRESLVSAVAEQARVILENGGWPIILPSPWLAAHATTEDDYVDVYVSILDRIDGPVFIHWLGAMFLPSLEGYFPGASFARVMAHDPAKVRGCKLSLLDADLERTIRREIAPREQIVLTGDDFNFPELILGGASAPTGTIDIGGRAVPFGDFSHALLGVLDGVAAPASRALRRLDAGDASGYLRIMAPCQDLGRVLFEEPTSSYKAGLAFLAWLDGLQENRMLPNRRERERDREHYLRIARLAATAEVFSDPDRAQRRLEAFCSGD